MSAFFYLAKLCCFGYYQKNNKYVIVLETYVTHDVISNNLVGLLMVLILNRFSVETFLNARKWLVGSSKIYIISQLMKSIKFHLTDKRRWKR